MIRRRRIEPDTSKCGVVQGTWADNNPDDFAASQSLRGQRNCLEYFGRGGIRRHPLSRRRNSEPRGQSHVHVRVVESRNERSPSGVDDPRGRALQRANGGARSYRNHSIAAYGERLGPRCGGVGGKHLRVQHHERRCLRSEWKRCCRNEEYDEQPHRAKAP